MKEYVARMMALGLVFILVGIALFAVAALISVLGDVFQ